MQSEKKERRNREQGKKEKGEEKKGRGCGKGSQEYQTERIAGGV